MILSRIVTGLRGSVGGIRRGECCHPGGGVAVGSAGCSGARSSATTWQRPRSTSSPFSPPPPSTSSSFSSYTSPPSSRRRHRHWRAPAPIGGDAATMGCLRTRDACIHATSNALRARSSSSSYTSPPSSHSTMAFESARGGSPSRRSRVARMQANLIRNDVDVGIIFPRWHCYHTSSFLSSSASRDNDGRDNNSSSTTDCKKVDDASGESKSNGRGINDERKDYESESNNKNNKNKNNNNSNINRNGKISGNDANDHDHDGMEPRFQDTELPTHSFFGATSTSSVAPGDGGGGNIDDDVLGDRGAEKKKPPPAHPSVSKMLSLLYPEAKSLLVALGFLTIATSATMQFPNAIGQIVDILSSSSSSEVIDAVVAAASSSSTETATGGGGGGADGGGVDAIVGGGAVASSAAAGDLPLAHQHLAQHVLLQEQIQTIGLQLTAFFAMGALGTFASSAIFDSTGERIGADLRKRLFANLIRRDLNFFANNRSGELANRLSTDVHEVVEHLVHNMAYFLYNMIRALTAVASMAIISPSLTACISVPMPVLLGGCAMYYGGHIRHWTGRQLDVLARSTHVATERFGGISTVLSFGQRRAEERRYSDVIEASYGYARRVAIYEGAFWGSSYLVGHAALMIVLMLGSHQVLGGEISPGHLAGFCMYAIHLTDAVVELSQATGGFLRAQGSGARLFDLLEGRDDHVGGTADSTDATTAVEDGGDDGIDRDLVPLVTNAAATLPSSYDSTVHFEGVEFSYPSHRNKSILGKTSFTLQNGEMLAITGLSGSGKSSIVSLLMRFYEPSAGRITLGGSDVRRLDVDWLRSQVGLVGQEPILFHASVYENVSYGRPDATRDEVVEACMAAGAHRFVLELPDQYDTIVGGRGANISGGQKQRLCIARALLTKPRILALDEASSALDGPTEQDFLHRLRLLLESKDNNISSILFITHKKSVLRACDRVLVLSKGKIVEVGEFDSLDKSGGDELKRLMEGNN